MKITRASSFANTAPVGNITYRMIGVYGVAIILGLVLFQSPIFQWNLPAMLAYVFFASIMIGQTPTHRTILFNLYGILFKKPTKMVVSDLATKNTIGHGIRDVIILPDVDAPALRMFNKQYAFVFNITSGLTQWSDEDDYTRQAHNMKTLLNILEADESLMIVVKQDADTGMLQLEQSLVESEHYEGSDLEALSAQRRDLLHRVATTPAGRSVQQYAILKVKPKNVSRTLKALHRTARIMHPASNPVDIVLSTEGLEAGAEQDNYKVEQEIKHENEGTASPNRKRKPKRKPVRKRPRKTKQRR